MNAGPGLLLLILMLVSCAVSPGMTQPPPDPPPVWNPAPQPTPEPPAWPLPDPGFHEETSATFGAESGYFRNPERGFHQDANLLEDRPFRRPEDRRYDLVRSIIILDEYRTSPLPGQLLDTLDRSFTRAREYGVKIVLRFAYSWNGTDEWGDTSPSWALMHIRQLTPLLQRNSDVIATLQAGFIGDWGEWHSRSSQLLDHREEITLALLEAMPTDRMVQIRTPYHARVTFPDELDASAAFSNTPQARIGFMNDCFLAGDGDAGTFNGPHDVAYARALAPWTVVGGETCQVQMDEVRHECPSALENLAVYHWDYLNVEFNGAIIQDWRDGGCFTEIENRLGYRFNLVSASIDHQGSTLNVEVKLNNSGFGKLYNPRPLNLVLVNGAEVRFFELTSDARRVLPGAGEEVTLNYPVSTEGLPPGDYSVYLELPDAAPRLRSEPMFSIRLGGLLQGRPVWQQQSGLNYLGLGFTQR